MVGTQHTVQFLNFLRAQVFATKPPPKKIDVSCLSPLFDINQIVACSLLLDACYHTLIST